jgi:hypothetical protein
MIVAEKKRKKSQTVPQKSLIRDRTHIHRSHTHTHKSLSISFSKKEKNVLQYPYMTPRSKVTKFLVVSVMSRIMRPGGVPILEGRVAR